MSSLPVQNLYFRNLFYLLCVVFNLLRCVAYEIHFLHKRKLIIIFIIFYYRSIYLSWYCFLQEIQHMVCYYIYKSYKFKEVNILVIISNILLNYNNLI